MKFVVACRWMLGLLLATLLGYGAFCFQVSEIEQAVVTRFGRPVRVATEPGVRWKLPWPFESVARFDARLDVLEGRLSEALTMDKRNVILPYFVVWKIEDPLRFLQSTRGDVTAFRARLDGIATSARNSVLGNYLFAQLVSVAPGEVRLAQIEAEIRAIVSESARDQFGVEVESVGIRQLALPAANTPFVFDRMRAERAQDAARFRAEGQREADEIRATAEAEKTALLAEARRYADGRRGAAEAEAARITAEAYRQDPELFTFLRELEVLRKVAGRNITVVTDPRTPPFHLLVPPSPERPDVEGAAGP
ncbi:protease modulator HflC [Opitutales bacterium ASA1]|uniref:protease modulator HflC n=1 Tax=Congregicoccus parvus TaxID=3081749 RepID=UPI002B31C9C1|nr:protease modulator HflC [Opitutales bacterium ASA1]